LNKNFKKKFLQTIAPPILYALMHLLYFTCKKKFHYDTTQVDENPCVFVFWHGELIMLPFAYVGFRKRKSIDSIISEHSDGEVASRFIELFGGGTIRGSSTRGGIKALKAAFKSISQGRDIGITPDGPKGPRHSVSSGVVLISQKKNIPIVAMNCRPTSCWRFESWDKFFIPKPFCTLHFYFSEPFYLSDLDETSAKELIKERLMEHAF
jgi:lysophospholipid acyltransferase (LPLAT)-like uncharacterized protein